MVDTAISLLNKPTELKPALISLAQRHIRYGAEAAHYAVVGEVLLYALQTCLGPELWTADVALAWLTVYSVMLETMLTVYLPGGGATAAN